jgi:hypothetical protein
MRLGRFRARLTCLWFLLLDPRFLRTDLRTMWLDVSRDTTMMAGRLTSFAGMLLSRLCKFKVSIITNNKVLTSLRYVSYGKRHIYLKRVSHHCPFWEHPAYSKVSRILTNNSLV